MDRECPIWLKSKKVLREVNQKFGSWMMATTPNLARKNVIKVAGFDNDDSKDESLKNNNETEVKES